LENFKNKFAKFAVKFGQKYTAILLSNGQKASAPNICQRLALNLPRSVKFGENGQILRLNLKGFAK